MIKKITKNKGFTLVETLVAISILVLALTGPLAIIAQSLKASNFSRDEITAAYLAQEPIEFIRNMRDQNTLRSTNASFWLTGPSGGAGNGPENLVTDLNNNQLIGNPGDPIRTKLVWSGGTFHLETCQQDCYVTYDPTAGAGQNKVMYGNDDNNLLESIYTREVYLTKGDSDPSETEIPERELVVTVVVSWVTAGIAHDVTVSERLFNWQLEK